MNFEELLDLYGKRCPKCMSHQITSNNSEPLRHRCLDCGHEFNDDEAYVKARELKKDSNGV